MSRIQAGSTSACNGTLVVNLERAGSDPWTLRKSELLPAHGSQTHRVEPERGIEADIYRAGDGVHRNFMKRKYGSQWWTGRL